VEDKVSKMKGLKTLVTDVAENAGKIAIKAGSSMVKLTTSVTEAGVVTVEKIKQVDLDKYKFTVEDVLTKVVRAPLVRINRTQFLEKELSNNYPREVVNLAVEKNPAFAGITREEIDEIAKHVINYETKRVTVISTAAGIPGGTTMAASIPIDITQYFGFTLRVMQKLAYLYGFSDFDLTENSISDEIMNQIIVFLGVMFGVQQAHVGIKIIAKATSEKASRSLAQKALTKTAYYPLIKKVALSVGIKMNKTIFANAVSKVVPVLGGGISGGITYFTFKPNAKRLQRTLKRLNLSDPEFYKHRESLESISEFEIMEEFTNSFAPEIQETVIDE